ncbi:mechanosensitive ion channel family protein [Candidatus Poribacteria bacterium]|nr:mechanosensitive ion channel family protein [Candidatus Poribacteria bacterium]
MQEYVDTSMKWLVENGTAFAFKIAGALILLLAGKILIGTISRAIEVALKKSGKLNDLLQIFLVNLVSKSLWVVLWLLALAHLGVEVGPLIAGLGVAGFIAGFAVQDTLGNFAAGLMILANDPFRAGHYVEVGGHGGIVKELNLMATTLTTPDNKKITIPNSKVWGQPIVNFSALDTRRVDMSVGISYGSDIGKARGIIMDLLAANPSVLKDPVPIVEVVAMADSSVNLVVRPWVKTADYWAVYWATQQAIKEAFQAGGIEIPFPQRVIHQLKT